MPVLFYASCVGDPLVRINCAEPDRPRWPNPSIKTIDRYFVAAILSLSTLRDTCPVPCLSFPRISQRKRSFGDHHATIVPTSAKSRNCLSYPYIRTHICIYFFSSLAGQNHELPLIIINETRRADTLVP